tara:strand:- start:1262 stop:1642 length:381 start_codon:yes stop_codon:yes gene_type:complete
MNNHSANGFSLLEVLISLFLLSLVLLGVFASQATSLQQARGTHNFLQAMTLSQNMAVYLRTHHLEWNRYDQRWQSNIQAVLPGARGDVSGDYPEKIIKIAWGDQRLFHCDQNRVGVSGCVILKVTP